MNKLVAITAIAVSALSFNAVSNEVKPLSQVGEFGEIVFSLEEQFTTAGMSIPEYKKYFRYIIRTDEVANITNKCRILTYVYHDIDYNTIIPVDFRIEAYSKTKLHKEYRGLRGRFASAQRLC
ncbi:hypothetical protein [Pseudoalteromonas luteoviolacea]|uniref:hypothetical protein n=1 Tax=Pseudoalteromonas luteoviolacea TaxID=43657 RepID=UPI0011544EA4|nr:hypothetical protein [Pseudoalteromonas luteoviolacea]TQF72981.1 hypothetical protein FLM44_18940 [Pseudoalteromonas luteoviolacea]